MLEKHIVLSNYAKQSSWKKKVTCFCEPFLCFKQKTPKTLKTIITWLYKSAAFGWYGMKTLTHIQKKEMCRTHHSRVELWTVHQTLRQKGSLRPTVQCNLYKYESNLVQSLFILLLSGIISDFFYFFTNSEEAYLRMMDSLFFSFYR